MKAIVCALAVAAVATAGCIGRPDAQASYRASDLEVVEWTWKFEQPRVVVMIAIALCIGFPAA